MTNINLYISNKTWMLQTDDPEVARLFGTDTLPTPLTDQTSAEDALRAIQTRNPSANVTIRSNKA